MDASVNSAGDLFVNSWDEVLLCEPCAVRLGDVSAKRALTPDDVISEALGPFEPTYRCIQSRRDGKCYVYFIGGEDTPIKIGFSIAPHERLAALQTSHWQRMGILALVEGGMGLEFTYHQRFAHFRMVGEWFARHPEILAEIDRLNQQVLGHE